MTGSVSQNSDYNDYLIQQQQRLLQDQGTIKEEETGQSVIHKIATNKVGDAIETSEVSQSSTTIPLASFNAPDLPSNLQSIPAVPVSDHPTPIKYNDLLEAARTVVSVLPPSEKTANGLTMIDYLKAIGDAIKDAEEELAKVEETSDKVQKNLDSSKDPLSGIKRTLDYKAGAERVIQYKMIDQAEETLQKGGNIEQVLQSVFKNVTLSPKMEKLMVLLGELETLQRNARANVTGGIILANTPKVVAEMQELGIDIPLNAGSYSGIAERMVSKHIPPYNNPEYVNLVKTLPKGWDVISSLDLNSILLKVGNEIKLEAGDSFGIMQKPLQELFGMALFSTPPVPPESLALMDKTIQELQQEIDYCKKNNLNEITINQPRFIFGEQYPSFMTDAVNLGLAPNDWINFVTPPSGWGDPRPSSIGIGVNDLESVLKRIEGSFQLAGGDTFLHPQSPTDPGQGLFTTGAVGELSSPVTNSLNRLFNADLNNNLFHSGLTPIQKENVQSIASLAVTTSSLSSAAKTNDKKNTLQNLSQEMQTLQDSGTAEKIVKAVIGRSDENAAITSQDNYSDFQTGVLGKVTQAFMVNLSAATATSPEGTLQSDNINGALDSLRNQPEISAMAQGAQAFLNTDSSKLGNKESVQELVTHIMPGLNTKGLSDHQIEEIEALQNTIKMLKKILEELLSGSITSQMLGKAIQEISGNMGNDNNLPPNISHNSV